MIDDALTQLLLDHEVRAGMVDDINKVGLSKEERQDLWEKYKDKSKSQLLLGVMQFISQKKEESSRANSEKKDISNIENTPLFLALKPVMGTALAAETMDFLTSVYKDFNHLEIQNKYVDFMQSVPEEDRMPVVFSTLKVANIAKMSMEENSKDDYANRDAYQNADILISHTLPAIYSWGTVAKEFVSEIGANVDLVRRLRDNPLSYARTLLFNEPLRKEEKDFAEAKEQILGITHSCGDDKLNSLRLFIDESVKVSEKFYFMTDYRKASRSMRMNLFKSMLRTPVKSVGRGGFNETSGGRYG